MHEKHKLEKNQFQAGIKPVFHHNKATGKSAYKKPAYKELLVIRN